MRYLLHESEHPVATDYYYECTKTTNSHAPAVYAHTHDFYEIYMFLSGSVKLFIEDQTLSIKRGDIVIIPPYTIHQPLADEPDQVYDRIYLYITEACLSSFQFNEHSLLHPIQMAMKEKQYHFHISDEEDYGRIFQGMMSVYQSKNNNYYGKELLNRSRILEVMTLINKHILLGMSPRRETHINPLIDQILAYINEHYMDPLSLDELADRFYINKYALTKLFKKQTTRTVHNYILLKRISVAKQKMTEGVSPSSVCFEVGFKDYSTFYRTFQKMEQISPKAFFEFCRKQN